MARVDRREHAEGEAVSHRCGDRVPTERFWTAHDGVVAVEVGLLAAPFFMLLVGVAALGVTTWWHSVLDFATQKAARQIMTGALQSANTTQSQFKLNTICPYLPQPVFDCSKLVINLAVIVESDEPTGWYQYVNDQKTALKPPDAVSVSSNSFCFGGGNAYQVLQVAYPYPILSRYIATPSALATGYSLITSTVAFKNEPFQGGGGTGDNC
jgi:Flp pilus assembly pilin Flp